MKNSGNAEWNTGLMTWVIGQDLVLIDDVAANLFGLPEGSSDGIKIDAVLAQVIEGDRSRVARELYGCITDGARYEEEFDVSVGDVRRTLAMKGRAVGDGLFTCVVAPISVTTRPGRLLNLCLAAYDVARQEDNDAAALHLIGTFNFIGHAPKAATASPDGDQAH